METDDESSSDPGGPAPGLAQLRPGVLAYCRLVACGEVRATQVLIVEPGAYQTVVACPVACALAPSGRWAEPDTKFQAGLECTCTQPGLACAVVFYGVDTTALVTSPLPDALQFQTTAGGCGRPSVKGLMGLFYGDAHERSDRIQTDRGDLALQEGYHEVRIAAGSQLLLWNSVILVPSLLSDAECQVLVDAAERRAASEGGGAGRVPDKGLQRLRICDLGSEAQELSAHILLDRVLPFLEAQLPKVAHTLFGQASGLGEMCFSFSPLEPAVNRYTTGGEFKVHNDAYSLTVNVLLSEPGAFIGGGTAFWPQRPGSDCEDGVDADAAVLLRPRKGTGVLFNGNVQHMGRPVESGVRHLYVVSFHLDPLVPGHWEWDARLRVASQL